VTVCGFSVKMLSRTSYAQRSMRLGTPAVSLFVYVLMPDHLHVITDGACKPSDTLRFISGIVSQPLMMYLEKLIWRKPQQDGGVASTRKQSEHLSERQSRFRTAGGKAAT
jgi:hypothetical protein